MIEAIVSLALGIGTITYQELATKYGTKLARTITQTANQLNSLIAKNNTLANQLQDAYNSKNNALMNALLSSAGFGNIKVEISKKMKEAKELYDKNVKALNENTAELSNEQSRLSSGMSSLNTIAGNIAGENAIKDTNMQNITNKQGSVADSVNTAIQGGLK